MYGCGPCDQHLPAQENDTQEARLVCRECKQALCNAPHVYWGMQPRPLPLSATPPPWVPFKARAGFERYEEVAGPLIWLLPVLGVAVLVGCGVVMVVRANRLEWYYWCVRYWG